MTQVLNVLADQARSRADWRRVEQLYRQFTLIVSSEGNVVPPSLVGRLAESTGRVFAHYHDREGQFIDDLLAVWSEVDGLEHSKKESFRRLYRDQRLERFREYNPEGLNRRRPKPFEASVETARRLLDLNHIRKALEPIGTAAILGGSASYGRHYNTVGASAGGKPSDLDVILIVPAYSKLTTVAKALKNVAGMNSGSLEKLSARIKPFFEIRKTKNRCIFSHKVKLWEDPADPVLQPYQIESHYLLSLHVVDVSDFDYIILTDIPVLSLNRNKRFARDIWDFRDTRHPDNDSHRSFSGIDIHLKVSGRKTEGGYLTKRAVCRIEEDRYYPGLQQNVILPQTEIRWEDPQDQGLKFRTLGFRWKIMERLREERVLRPFEDQTLGLSHVRSEVFAPHITERANHE